MVRARSLQLCRSTVVTHPSGQSYGVSFLTSCVHLIILPTHSLWLKCLLFCHPKNHCPCYTDPFWAQLQFCFSNCFGKPTLTLNSKLKKFEVQDKFSVFHKSQMWQVYVWFVCVVSVYGWCVWCLYMICVGVCGLLTFGFLWLSFNLNLGFVWALEFIFKVGVRPRKGLANFEISKIDRKSFLFTNLESFHVHRNRFWAQLHFFKKTIEQRKSKIRFII